jgi:hypothetical protein
MNKNIAKILDMFKGGGKILLTAAVFIGRFYLLLFEHLFESQHDYF